VIDHVEREGLPLGPELVDYAREHSVPV